MTEQVSQKHHSRGQAVPDDLQNEREVVVRADLELSDLSSNGGLLTTEQNNQFIRTLIDQPTLLNQVRNVEMNSPSMEVNKVKFGSRILKAANQTIGSRALSSGDRSEVTTSKITLNSKEVIAEVHLPYEVLEDNIERGNLQSTILDLIAERAALDMEEMVISGDTASGDSFLALQNGVIKLATSNVVNANNSEVTSTILSNTFKAIPTPFRRNKNLMRYFVSHDIHQDYALKLSTRGTNLGDAVLTGDVPLRYNNIPLIGVANMPDSTMILTNPQNILFGIQRNVRIESERLISERIFKIVLTARVAVQIEEETALAKTTNLVTA